MKVSRSRIGAVGRVRLMSRTRRTIVASLLALLFPITAPGVTNSGFAIDYSDLTEEKLAWRKNLFTETEFRNGLVDAPTRSTGVTASTIAGYAGAIAFPVSASSEYAYKSAALLQGTMVGFSLVVEMGDDLGPPVIGGNLNGVDMSPIVGGAVVASASVQVVPLAGRVYLLRVPTLAVPTSTATYGIVRYAGNSSRTLKVTAYMLNLGPLLPYQPLTDVSTEFLAAFPYHLLYRDLQGTVACYQLEDVCGLALDAKFGGARGPELWIDPPSSIPAGWTNNGGGSYTHAAGTASSIGSASGAAPGKFYEVSCVVAGRTAGTLTLYAGSTGASLAVTANGPFSARYTATGAFGMYVFANGVFDGTVSKISIKEVYGDHAVQATVGDRPVISGKHNQLANSAWQGGGSAPTGWLWAFATGASAPNGTVDGNVIYRQTANNERPFLQATAPYPLVGTGSITLSLEVGQIYSGSVRMDGLVLYNTAVPLTLQYYVNGNPVTPATLATANSKIQLVLSYTGASGTMASRFGAGTSGPVTVDLEMSRPTLTPGGIADAPRYQRVNSDSTYDYAGFPIGARFNGINSWMQIPTSSLAGRSKLVLATSFRKDADPTTAVDQALLEVGGSYATTAGRMVLCTAVAGNTQTGAYVRGSASTVGATVAAPTPSNSVVVACVDWTTGAPQRAVRRNGVFIGGTPGTGVGGDGAVVDAQPIFIGRRGGAGTALNGVVFRVLGYGVDFSDRYGQIEGWLNERTKVALG